MAEAAGAVPGFDEADSPGQITILRLDPGAKLQSHCGPLPSQSPRALPLLSFSSPAALCLEGDIGQEAERRAGGKTYER